MSLRRPACISIHAPREGSDGTPAQVGHLEPISIHAPREGSDLAQYAARRPLPISIHAPREGSDCRSWTGCTACSHFYPRSPRGERQADFRRFWPEEEFLSTLPARGATEHLHRWDTWNPFLSTLPARGATVRRMHGSTESRRFLSTLPARGATDDGMSLRRPACISIHAPREGSDAAVLIVVYFLVRFLSKLPARGATNSRCVLLLALTFLSTLPARGATERRLFISDQKRISIHAPREGSDGVPAEELAAIAHFYPRSPRGERLTGNGGGFCFGHFYPRSPRGERPRSGMYRTS